jgi:thiol-disulfide isomerase/thioredoxin
MRFILNIIFFLSLFIPSISATTPTGGYKIEVELQHNTGDSLLLGYYYGKAQYLKDTAIIDKGKFIFQGDSALAPGVYLLVIPPDNNFIHVIVTEEQQRFSVSVDLDKIVASAKFKGSPESDIYYTYLRELDKRRPLADSLKKEMAKDSVHYDLYKARLDSVDKEVMKVQDNILSKYPASTTAMLIKMNRDVEIPKFEDVPEEDRRLKQFEYYRAHYFDNIDFNDPRLMRSGLIQPRIDYFLQKLSYQMPDSQIVSMDYLLNKMKDNKEAFQYYLVNFLNDSVKSKKMGMDAVYVHLVDNYYAKGLAPWVDEEQLGKLKAQSETLRPILIGQIAPDLKLYKESGDAITIHSIKADYTVLLFWDPECGHCKKAIPFIVDFYNAYKDKGVELVAICTKTGENISSCWDAVKERGMGIWVNVADQYLKSRYKTVYDVKTTPQIYILDKDKKIIVKKIAGEDLMQVMGEVMKNDELKASK